MKTRTSRPKCVLGIRLVIPSPLLIRAFTNTAKPMFDPNHRNTEQSRILATLRESLLPKVLSGDVTISI